MAVTWGDKTALTPQTAIDNSTEEFLGTIDLATGLSAHIILEVDNEHADTVTDDLFVRIYPTLDAASEVFDDIAYMTVRITPATVALERQTIVVSGIYKFRIGCLSSGTTNTYAAGGDYRVRTA